ncbi:MAG: hypothetical protein ACTHOU_11290, partial [Aureliella sp.]
MLSKSMLRRRQQLKTTRQARRGRLRSLLIGVESLEPRIVMANAIFAPGSDGNNQDVIGVLNTSEFRMDSTDELRIQLGGDAGAPSFDQVVASGSSQLAGVLKVSLLDGLDPAVGSTFQVVDSVGSTGAFQSIDLPTLSGDKRLVPVASPNGLTLVVADGLRPTGGSQLRLSQYSEVAALNDFLSGLSSSVSFAGLDLTVLGQQVHGDFALGVGVLDGEPVLAASATGISASLGGDLIALDDGSASVFMSPSGVALNASVSVALKNGLPLSFSGTFGLQVNTTGDAVQGTVAGITVDVPAGNYFRAEAIGAQLTALGQSMSGDFILESATVIEDSLPVQVVTAGFSNVDMVLGSSEAGVHIHNGMGGFQVRPTGVAAQFEGDVELVGTGDAFSLSGRATGRLNNTGKAVSASYTLSDGNNVTIDFSDTGTDSVVEAGGALKLDIKDVLAVEGAFSIRKQSALPDSPANLLVGVSQLNAFFGDKADPLQAEDDTGLSITSGELGLLIEPASAAGEAAKYALAASGTVDLVGVDKLSLGGDLKVRRNTTGHDIQDLSIATPNEPVTLNFSQTEGDPLSVVGENLHLDIGGFVSLSGNFAFEKTSSTVDSVTSSQLKVGASEVTAFFGDPGQDDAPSDDTGVVISDGQLGLIVNKTTDTSQATQAPSTYALVASGSAELVGIDGLELGGSLEIRKNTTGETVDETIGGVEVKFDEGEENLQSVGGTLDLEVSDFVSIHGAFGFTKESETIGTVTNSKILIGATVDAFFGANQGEAGEVGVEVTNAELGLVLYRTTGSSVPNENKSSYALSATSGNVELLGIDDLTLGGSVAIRVNNTGKDVVESIAVPGAEEPIEVNFEGSPNVTFFGGGLHLETGPYTLAGAFSFGKDVSNPGETKLLVGVSGVHVGMDSGDVGVELNDGRLGLVVVKPTAGGASTYALDASGTVGVYGLPLIASGTVGVRQKTIPGAVLETLQVPNAQTGEFEDFEINFGATDPNSQFSGTGLTLGVPDVFAIGGDVIVSPGATATAPTQITIRNAALSLSRGEGVEAMRLGLGSSAVRFQIGGGGGFKLLDLDLAVPAFDFTPGSDGSESDPGTGTDPGTETDPGTGTGNEPGTGIGAGAGTGAGITSLVPPTQPGTKLGPLTISNPSVTLKGFELGTTGASPGAFPLVITVGIGVGEASLNVGAGLSATAKDIQGSFDVGVDLSLSAPYVDFSSVGLTGDWDLKIGSIQVQAGSFLQFTTTSVAINPSAADDEYLVQFGSVGAGLKLGVLDLSASISNFAISGAGQFVATQQFVKASASVDTKIGPIQLSGSVTDLEIDMDLLRAGKFPVVDVGTVAVHASGPAFGGAISGDFLAGIIKLDSDGNRIAPDDTTAVVDDRVFYTFIAAGFTIPGLGQGINIKLGLSENGPLAVYVDADVEVPLGPTGLVLSELRGGVFFNAATLPSITDARQLASPAFAATGKLTLTQWQAMLEQQVVRQAGGGAFGYLFDLPFASSATATAVINALDNRTVSLALRDELAAQKLVITPAATADVLEVGKRWAIHDGSSVLLLEKRIKPDTSVVLSTSRVGLVFGDSGDLNEWAVCEGGAVPAGKTSTGDSYRQPLFPPG